jgi:hypothetical protein
MYTCHQNLPRDLFLIIGVVSVAIVWARFLNGPGVPSSMVISGGVFAAMAWILIGEKEKKQYANI